MTLEPETQPPEDSLQHELIDSRNPNASRDWMGRISLSGILSWFVIIAITSFLCFEFSYSLFFGETTTGGDANSMELMPVQMQGKILVAQKGLGGMTGDKERFQTEMEKNLAALDIGVYEQRLALAIIKNEILGASQALDYLEALDDKVAETGLELTEQQSRLRALLGRIFEEYESGTMDSSFVAEADQTFLKDRLQWLGELALFPLGTEQAETRKQILSQSTALLVTFMLLALTGFLILIAGFAIGITLLVLAKQNKLFVGFQNQSNNHNVYAETFALWMLIFFGSSHSLGFFIQDAKSAMFIQPLIFFGSLLTLAWPVIRGIPFSRVRQDIGWTCRRPGWDTGSAILSYLSTFPLMLPALAIVAILVIITQSFQEASEFGRPIQPGHPIQQFVADGDVTMLALVFVAVCICAPVVEETMFRGVFYRHLRDLTGRWGRWLSVPISALINGIVFASCHPQGLIAIPMLATLAIGFSFAREWRGSLISPMVMHAIHNGALTCFMLLFL